jgi:tetratricopeptide (TPR) repeat protein
MSETEPPSPRCDNYDGYLTDEQGYAWDARDIVSVEDLEVHDDMLARSEETLGELVPADYDDFVRWGMARRWRQLGRLDLAAEVARTVVDGERDHAAIHYPEATLAVAGLLEEADQIDAAIDILDRLSDAKAPYGAYAQLAEAMIRLRRGDEGARERASEILDDLHASHPEDAELHFEVAEDLTRSGFGELAEVWIRRTREAAEKTGNRAVLVDLTLLEQRGTATEG